MKKKLIIYIAGYGRSGSTLLNYKLSKYISALGVGELANLNKEYSTNQNLKCSCKKNYHLCKLTKKLILANNKGNIKIWYKKIAPQVNIFIRFFFYLYILKIKKIKDANFDNTREIKKELNIIHSIFPDTIIIDSSKTTILTSNRPYILKKLGYKVIIIHIHRPFFSTLQSVLKGSNQFLKKQIKKEKSFRILRFVINYFISNFIALLLAKDFKYIYIKNIDLKKKQNLTLKKIRKFILKIAKNENIKFKKTSEIHIIGGNRLKNNLK